MASESAQGSLLWGIKASFREYVDAVSDGTVETAGVGEETSGWFAFTLADASEFDPATGHGWLRFSGSVVFSAYRGILLVRIRDPWITVGSDGGVLSIMHPAYRERTEERSKIATFALPAQHAGQPNGRWLIESPRLTADGSRALGDVYPVGTEVDPFEIRLGSSITANL